jgi:hypothetical protein
MRSRCLDTNSHAYDRYGGRGITICARWMEFVNFYADMRDKPGPEYSIERIDNDKGYWCGKPECPECGSLGRKPNCKWGTDKEQALNTRRNVIVSYQGKEYVLGMLAETLNMGYHLLYNRIVKLHWPEERWTEERKNTYIRGFASIVAEFRVF